MDSKWEGVVGKGPRAGIQTRDTRSAMAVHLGALPTRLLVPTFSSWLKQCALTINRYAKPD